MRPAELDPVDFHLLDLLQTDGRMTNADLGKAVGLATSSVNERVRKLQERGVISGIHAMVDPVAIGLDLLAFVFVGLSDQAAEKAFLERIAVLGNVQECHHVTGAWNYLMKVRVPNTRMLESFFSEQLKTLPGVIRTETLIVLSTAKETAALTAEPGA